jgi:hypothetical protein
MNTFTSIKSCVAVRVANCTWYKVRVSSLRAQDTGEQTVVNTNSSTWNKNSARCSYLRPGRAPHARVESDAVGIPHNAFWMSTVAIDRESVDSYGSKVGR